MKILLLTQPMPAAPFSAAVQALAPGHELVEYRKDMDPAVLAEIEAVLGASEIVVCALPLTAQTQGLLDARAFAAMPRGSYLINVARGGHVVEADLIDAVRSGHLAGAALDVQRNEPMAADDPLWQVPGITITPHIAAQPAIATIAAQFVAGLRRIERGEPAPQAIDRTRGY